MLPNSPQSFLTPPDLAIITAGRPQRSPIVSEKDGYIHLAIARLVGMTCSNAAECAHPVCLSVRDMKRALEVKS